MMIDRDLFLKFHFTRDDENLYNTFHSSIDQYIYADANFFYVNVCIYRTIDYRERFTLY